MNTSSSESAMKDMPRAPSYIDFLWNNGMDHLGQGWYGWENGYRWTQTRAVFYLYVPTPEENPGRYFKIEGALFGRDPKTVELLMGGHLVKRWSHDPATTGKVTLTAPVPKTFPGGLSCECVLAVSKPYVPSAENASSGDERALGIIVKKMGIVRSPDDPFPKANPGLRERLGFYYNEIYKRAIRIDRKYPGNWISIYNFRKTKEALPSMSLSDTGNKHIRT